MLLKIYTLLTFIGSPLIRLYILKRKKKGKEDTIRFPERFGYASIDRPQGILVWIHAASVGETLSILPLINKISESHKNINFLLTTGTVNSAKLVENRLPNSTFHQYIPVDTPITVQRFLRHWQPNLALWVESELWPNLVTQTSQKCPIILVNGRISDNSYLKWQRYKSLAKDILKNFALTLPQSKLDAERFESLGAKNLKYIGNIKFDTPALSFDTKKMEVLLNQLDKRSLWLAASTHHNEEQMIASIHKELKGSYPNLLTIIAPRHPKRADEILEDIKKIDLSVAVRSKEQPISADTDIYLADTLGELGIFYRLVPIVFIGGSLVNNGGQNPLEAAKLDCAIIYGSHMENFKEIKYEMEQANAVLCIKDQSDLKQTFNELMMDRLKQEELAKAARKVVESKSGILDSYVEQISTYLTKIEKISSN